MVADVVEAARKRMDNPNRAAVPDNEDGLVRVALGHFVDESGDPGPERVERLGILRTRAFAGEPAGKCLAEFRLDLRHGQPFPRSERALAKARLQVDVEALRSGDDLGRLPRACEIARVDDVDVAQLGGDAASLVAADVVQARVGVPLPASVAVPVGFSVAYEEKGGHETH